MSQDKAKKLFRSIGDVDDDLVEEASQAKSKRKPFYPLLVKLVAAAAVVALIVGVGVTQLPGLLGGGSVTQILPAAEAGVMTAGGQSRGGPGTDAPTSNPRPFFNYNGYRYAFRANVMSNIPIAYNLTAFDFKKSVGTLEYDLAAVMTGESSEQELAGRDYAATFALGGTVWELPGYNPGFRLAVELDDIWYIADVVGRVDGEPLGAKYYIDTAKLDKQVSQILITPLNYGDILGTIDGETASKLLAELKNASPASLTNEEYETFARIQSQGGTYTLVVQLKDATSVEMLITPELGIISIGDDKYHLTDRFVADYGSLFEGLEHIAPPMQ
ncbi:MAG: hypothetical protein ACK5LX_05710 [Oscillospiraceae bacterium]